MKNAHWKSVLLWAYTKKILRAKIVVNISMTDVSENRETAETKYIQLQNHTVRAVVPRLSRYSLINPLFFTLLLRYSTYAHIMNNNNNITIVIVN